MDTLKNKKYEHFDYISRYTTVPYYFDTLHSREVYGIGTKLNKDTSYIIHQLTNRDTLDSLALKYYNNPTYWWVIAYFNNISDALEPLMYNQSTIKIPHIASIEFGADR